MSQVTHPELEGLGKYEYGWVDKNDAGSQSRRGLNEDVVRDISAKKQECSIYDLRVCHYLIKSLCLHGDRI
jgi:hypothetical protein